MNKRKIKQLARYIFDCGKNDLQDKEFDKMFETLWRDMNNPKDKLIITKSKDGRSTNFKW